MTYQTSCFWLANRFAGRMGSPAADFIDMALKEDSGSDD